MPTASISFSGSSETTRISMISPERKRKGEKEKEKGLELVVIEDR